MASDSLIVDDSAISELRAELIGRYQPIAVIARLNNQTERAVYGAIQRHDIPFIKVGNDRYVDPAVYAEMRSRRISKPPEPLPPPRKVGRPRRVLTAK